MCNQIPVLTFLLFSLISCVSPEKISHTNIRRIVVDAKQQSNVAKLVSQFKYIKLETNPDCLISNLDKILFQSGKFYILDSKVQTLFIFGADGKFISKISKNGRGPGEYTYLNDFDIDTYGNIYLLDLPTKSILKYNSEGIFLKKYQQDYISYNIAAIDTSVLMTYQSAAVLSTIEHKFIFLKENKKINSFSPLSQSNKVQMLNPFSINHSGGEILYNADLSDTIFSVSQDSLRAKYWIDFGDHSIKPELRTDYDYFIHGEKPIHEGWRISNYFEASNYFTCSYNLDGKSWSLYFSLKNNKVYTTFCPHCNKEPQKVINDFRAIGVCEDFFISYLKFYTVNEYKKEIKSNPQHMRKIIGLDNINLINSINDSDNPVLVLYKLN